MDPWPQAVMDAIELIDAPTQDSQLAGHRNRSTCGHIQLIYSSFAIVAGSDIDSPAGAPTA